MLEALKHKIKGIDERRKKIISIVSLIFVAILALTVLWNFFYNDINRKIKEETKQYLSTVEPNLHEGALELSAEQEAYKMHLFFNNWNMYTYTFNKENQTYDFVIKPMRQEDLLNDISAINRAKKFSDVETNILDYTEIINHTKEVIYIAHTELTPLHSTQYRFWLDDNKTMLFLEIYGKDVSYEFLKKEY